MQKIVKFLLGFALVLLATQVIADPISQQEINKRNAIAFCNSLANDKNFTAAREYIGDHYIQHDPAIEDGIDGLKKFFEVMTTIYPNMHTDIIRTSADGDFVYVHMHVVLVPKTRGSSMVDIFRFENGKIVEHWDTLQEVPALAMNKNGMF